MKKLVILTMLWLLSGALFGATDQKISFLKERKNSPLTRISYLKLLVKDKNKDAIPVIIDILKDIKEDPKLRINCAEGIDAFDHKEAVPLLLKIIAQEGTDEDTGKEEDQEEDYDVRIACARALGGFPDKETIVELGRIIALLQDAKGDIVDAIIDQLLKSKYKQEPEVMNAMTAAIKHRRADIRKKVVKILGEMNDKTALGLLMLGLEDKDAAVRTTAIEYIVKIGKGMATVTLIDALTDEKDEKVRELIADKLLKIDLGGLRKIWTDKLQEAAEKETAALVKTKLKRAADRLKKGTTVIR